MNSTELLTRGDLESLDRADPLRPFRDRFAIPEGVIYLDGNSLGALPKATPGALADTTETQWGDDLIASWNKHGWIDWPTRIAAKLAPIVGAKPTELLIADSTSVCLFKLLAAAVRGRPGRKTILSQKRNFPTDLYVAQGLAEMDSDKRAKIYQQACTILSQDLPWIFLWQTIRYGYVSNKIGNFLFTPAPSGGSYYDQAEKWFVRK